MITFKDVETTLKTIPLADRINMCTEMIGSMCAEGRCPKMSIPAVWTDEDLFITVTLLHAAARIKELEG